MTKTIENPSSRAGLARFFFFAFLASILVVFSPQPSAKASTPGGDDEAIRVVVSPSAKEPEPIAVPDLICTKASQATCSMLTTVLRRDLNLSGVFRVVNPDSYFAKAKKKGEAIPFSDWFNVGARYLVQGEVKSGRNYPDVRISLYDVVEKKPIAIKVKALGSGRKGDAVLTVHRHVNAFILAVTGRPGIFGSRIVFSRKVGSGHKDIMVIRFGDLRPSLKIADGTSNLFPDMTGGKLLYTSFKRNKPDLYLDGKLLTRDENQYRSGRLAPGGGAIVVSVDTGDGQSDIWLMKPDGKLWKNLTNSLEDEVSPRWSKDGRWIAYVSNRTGSPQLYAMDKSGNKKRRVSMAGNYNTSPDFGIHGRVAFAGMDDFVSEIFVTDLQGNMQRITQQQGSNKDPAWSPDGKYLVFVSTRNRKTQLFVGTEDGRWQFPLFEAPGVYSTPSWHW